MMYFRLDGYFFVGGETSMILSSMYDLGDQALSSNGCQ